MVIRDHKPNKKQFSALFDAAVGNEEVASQCANSAERSAYLADILHDIDVIFALRRADDDPKNCYSMCVKGGDLTGQHSTTAVFVPDALAADLMRQYLDVPVPTHDMPSAVM